MSDLDGLKPEYDSDDYDIDPEEEKFFLCPECLMDTPEEDRVRCERCLEFYCSDCIVRLDELTTVCLTCDWAWTHRETPHYENR